MLFIHYSKVVLSPGPGNPSDFALSTTIEFLIKNGIPGFGVCLGLQGMVEHFGGTLGVLGYPMHGKPSMITLTKAGQSETRCVFFQCACFGYLDDFANPLTCWPVPLNSACHSIFKGLPDSFEVARYHSLYGIKERMPSTLEITALSEDGVPMGIQHKTLPFAAVQFHPESILTSPAHGMTILENALINLASSNSDKSAGDGQSAKSGAELVGALEKLSITELSDQCEAAGLTTRGSKSELVVRLALWKHKSTEVKAGRLDLESLTMQELRELKQSLSLKGTAPTKEELLVLLGESLRS